MTVATGTAASLMGGVSLGVGNVDQFTVAIDHDTVNEEIVFVTGVSSDTLTIVRGRAGSSAIVHNGGAAVKHVLTSNDLDYYTSGIDAAVTLTGTQTLTNKTINAANNTFVGVSTSSATETLTNKTINSANNTLTGIATLTGTQTLTNKTLTSPSLSDATLTGTSTINTVAGGTTSTATVGAGYMGIPASAAAATGSYTVVAADAGEHIYSTATRTITIPANSALALPVGTTISFIAATGATVTIAITTDTLLLAGSGTTGSRTLAPFGIATAVKITSTSWIISGNGLS
jgi:hypothetical protein